MQQRDETQFPTFPKLAWHPKALVGQSISLQFNSYRSLLLMPLPAYDPPAAVCRHVYHYGAPASLEAYYQQVRLLTPHLRPLPHAAAAAVAADSCHRVHPRLLPHSQPPHTNASIICHTGSRLQLPAVPLQ